MSSEVATGGCLCGDVRLEINGPLTDAHWCACRRCQKWAGSPAVAWADVRAVGGVGPFHPGQRRGHCARCGSALCVFDEGSDIASVVLACLDDLDAHQPEGVSFPESLPRWLPAAGFSGPRNDEGTLAGPFE